MLHLNTGLAADICETTSMRGLLSYASPVTVTTNLPSEQGALRDFDGQLQFNGVPGKCLAI
jgi:hypothetical protein